MNDKENQDDDAFKKLDECMRLPRVKPGESPEHYRDRFYALQGHMMSEAMKSDLPDGIYVSICIPFDIWRKYADKGRLDEIGTIRKYMEKTTITVLEHYLTWL